MLVQILMFAIVIAIMPAQDPSDVQAKVKVIDLTNETTNGEPKESNVQYYVTFVARESPTEDGDGKDFPGHAYVVFAKEEKKPDELVQDFQAVGFYPKTASFRCVALKCEGAIKSEYSAGPKSKMDVVKLQARVDRARFDAARKVVEKWKSRELIYQLFGTNCVAFESDVALALKLKVPEGTFTTPVTFLDRLAAEN